MNRGQSNKKETTYFLIILYLVIYGVIILKPVLIPILFAALFGTLLVPVANLLERLKIKRSLSVIMSLLLLIIVFGGLVYLIQWQLSDFIIDLPELGGMLTDKLSKLQEFINKSNFFEINLETERLKEAIFSFAQKNTGSFAQILFSMLGGITIFLLIPVYIFLFLLYRDFLQEFVIRLFHEKTKENVGVMIKKIQKVSQSWLIGMFGVSIILSVLNSISLLAFGIEHAIFFGVLAGLLNVVPYLGPMFGSLLPILFAWITKDSIWYPAGILIYFYMVQLLESYFLTPTIVGGNVNINPLIVIVALVVGYFTWGVIGMILIIPTVAILKLLFDEIESLKPIGFLFGGIPGGREKPKVIEKLAALKGRIMSKK